MGRRKPLDPNRIAVVTVHGTGDTAVGAEGEKWFQNGSMFVGRLKARLVGQGIEADVIPFHWSGANSVRGRERSAHILARALGRYAKQYAGVHLIGHSHGGNVANEALSLIGWGGNSRAGRKVSSVTTVGTPFFKSQFGFAEGLIGVAFFALIASTIVLALAAVSIFVMLPTLHGDAARYAQDYARTSAAHGHAATPEETAAYVGQRMEEASLYRPILSLISFFLPVSFLTSLLVFPLVASAARSLLAFWRRRRDGAKFLTVWHPNDEAISFLQSVEKARVEAFPRWALWRGSSRSAILASAVILFGSLFLGVLFLASGIAGVQLTDADYLRFGRMIGIDGVALFGGTSTTDLGLYFILLALVGTPLIFAIVYMAVRILFGLVAELMGRDLLNTSVAGAMRGMAFGGDGFVGVGNVSTQSHTYGVRPLVLEGAVAERMREGAASAATALLDRYRWSLLNVGADTNSAITDLANDAMTWKCLIHTSYFDQPEVADAIGDYILEHVARTR